MDNSFNLISKINKKMANYIILELEKEGIDGLVMSHGSIILALSKKNTLNLKELANIIGKSPQTMSTLVRKLIKLNYIEQTTNPSDKRNKNLSLTEKGLKFIPVFNRISSDLYVQQYIGFSHLEQQTLRKLLMKLSNNFKDDFNGNK